TVAIVGRDGARALLHVGESGSLSRDGTWSPDGGGGPAHALVIIPAGESAAIHDPRPPTAIGIALQETCDLGASVAIGARDEEGGVYAERVARVSVAAGLHRYSVRCVQADGSLSEIAARGRLRVLRDSGRARLPRRPPTTIVDTDGRRYTVLYQHHLPEIRVRWAGAPPARRHRLRVRSGTAEPRTIELTEARHAFASGQLGEGVHELTLEAFPEGAAPVASPPTTIRIEFDNAAPTATLSSPADRSFARGATVRIEGVALEGWSVRAGDRELALDPQHRFAGEVATDAARRGVAVRLAHPERGVHYYVRHARP
ncbi:MAG: hypothetical protein M3Y87_37410, partial [Myxococcota bacterium]|nr:hypothetical protein [Myxococcota bacterium]